MRAVIDWSYDLLSPLEQGVFDELSVFASWFDLDAAHAVFGGDLPPDEATAAVLRLVDCSLAVARHRRAATQYTRSSTRCARYGIERLRERNALEAPATTTPRGRSRWPKTRRSGWPGRTAARGRPA